MAITINRKTLVIIVLNSYFWQFDAIFDHFEEVIFGQTKVKLDKKKSIELYDATLFDVCERLNKSYALLSKLPND